MTKKIWIGLLVFVFILGFASCPDGDDPNIDDPNGKDPVTPAVYKMMFEDCQVWERNYDTGKLRELHYEFTGDDRDIEAFSYKAVYDEDGKFVTSELKKIGASGNIINGLLSFDVEALEDDFLLPDSDTLLKFIFTHWYNAFWTNNNISVDFSDTITIVPADAKGNSIQFLRAAPDYLNWELISGTADSLSMEYVWFIYMNKPCHITAEEFTVGVINYTYKALDLRMNEGWNMLGIKETYTTSGASSFSREIKKPDLKWALVDPANTRVDLSKFDFED